MEESKFFIIFFERHLTFFYRIEIKSNKWCFNIFSVQSWADLKKTVMDKRKNIKNLALRTDSGEVLEAHLNDLDRKIISICGVEEIEGDQNTDEIGFGSIFSKNATSGPLMERTNMEYEILSSKLPEQNEFMTNQASHFTTPRKRLFVDENNETGPKNTPKKSKLTPKFTDEQFQIDTSIALQKEGNSFLKKIVEQNEKIIEQNEALLRTLVGWYIQE